MARHFLSIQKKFLLLLLLVGLIPAFIGIVMTALGGRYSFARATMSSLEADAEEIGRRLGEGGPNVFEALATIVATSGGDFEQTVARTEALTQGPAASDFDAIVRYRSEEEFDVHVSNAGRPSAAPTPTSNRIKPAATLTT